MGPTWGPPVSCRPQMGPMLAPWALLSGKLFGVAHCVTIMTRRRKYELTYTRPAEKSSVRPDHGVQILVIFTKVLYEDHCDSRIWQVNFKRQSCYLPAFKECSVYFGDNTQNCCCSLMWLLEVIYLHTTIKPVETSEWIVIEIILNHLMYTVMKYIMYNLLWVMERRSCLFMGPAVI